MISSLSIAAPAYQEEANIEQVVRRWATFLGQHSNLVSYEIVICNDGSRDRTREILDRLKLSIPQLKVLHFERNKGAAAALASAINGTTCEWVLLLDSDGQFPIENLSHFERALTERPALAYIGYRPKKEDTLFARFGSWSSGVVCNLIYGTRFRDFNCALKLVRGDLLRSLGLEAKGLNYSTEISARILERNVMMQEVEVSHLARKKGKSSLKALKGALHRMLFVFYLAIRKGLLKREVIFLAE